MHDSHSSAIERSGAAISKRGGGADVCEQLVVISSEFSVARNKPTYGRRCDALAIVCHRSVSRNGQK